MRLYFDHLDNESNNINTLFFKPEKQLTYTAGQYVELTLNHSNPDERGIKRWFTLSSSPTDDLLSITTKFTPSSGSSFKKALAKLEPGDAVNITGPMGDFVLPKLIQTPLVFVAGGIGITPFHSILSWLIATNEKRSIKIIYGVKTEEGIIFQETFHKADQHVTLMIEAPSSSWGGERGQISAEFILGITNPSEDALVYLSGPEPMVENLSTDLENAGIKKQQLVLDLFSNYTDI